MPYKDPERQREYQTAWYVERRVEWLRGKSCAACGSTRNLEVDHKDPAQKWTHRIWSYCEKRRLAELAKCQVLCKTCHKAKTRRDGSSRRRK